MNAYQIIIRPLITEKNTALMELNKYSFEVAVEATKPDIKKAIEEIFKVQVRAVHHHECARQTTPPWPRIRLHQSLEKGDRYAG